MTKEGRRELVVGCLFFLSLMCVFPLIFAGCYMGSHIQTSDGYRDGTIRKLSRTGIFWKTWECEVLGDGMKMRSTDKGSSLAPETFQYTIESEELANRIGKIPPNRKVRVYYRKKLTTWLPDGETPYKVYDFEELPD